MKQDLLIMTKKNFIRLLTSLYGQQTLHSFIFGCGPSFCWGQMLYDSLLHWTTRVSTPSSTYICHNQASFKWQNDVRLLLRIYRFIGERPSFKSWNQWALSSSVQVWNCATRLRKRNVDQSRIENNSNPSFTGQILEETSYQLRCSFMVLHRRHAIVPGPRKL